MGLLAATGFLARANRVSLLSRAVPAAIADPQERRRSLLRWAVDRSPFYRRRFGSLDVTRCGLAESSGSAAGATTTCGWQQPAAAGGGTGSASSCGATGSPAG